MLRQVLGIVTHPATIVAGVVCGLLFGFYVPKRAQALVPANSYRVRLEPNGEIVWETVRDGKRVRYQNEPETGFRLRYVADLLKLLPIDSQL